MRKGIIYFQSVLFFFTCFILVTCKKKDKDDPAPINIFSLEDDKKLRAEMDAFIHSDTSGYVVLDRNAYPESYAYLDAVTAHILSSSHIAHKDDFVWKAAILKDDTILNAFATPGGYFYVYTGLIRYLETADHFAGVVGHEIAHADRRHSTAQMTKQHGLQLLFDVVFGRNPNAVKNIAGGLATLSFSRDHETEADEFSVKYLCQPNQQYEADGAAGFFEKLLEEGAAGNTPEFLSTHPNPTNRVESIKNKALELGCDTTERDNDGFHAMKMELGFE